MTTEELECLLPAEDNGVFTREELLGNPEDFHILMDDLEIDGLFDPPDTPFSL